MDARAGRDAGFATADLLDDGDGALVSCEVQWVSYGGLRAFHGRIRTVRCLEDSGLIKQVVGERVDGGVIVIDGAASPRTALMGGDTAALAARNGWSGMVINGMVRDVDELSAVPIGIRALGSNPRRPGRSASGEVDVPVQFGGVWFRPGEPLWSDADGVITSAP